MKERERERENAEFRTMKKYKRVLDCMKSFVEEWDCIEINAIVALRNSSFQLLRRHFVLPEREHVATTTTTTTTF